MAGDQLRIAGAIATYMVFSISIVVLNKMLLSENKYYETGKGKVTIQGYNFGYPITLTWIQNIVALLCVELLNILRTRTNSPSFWPDHGLLLAPSQWYRAGPDTRPERTKHTAPPAWFDPLPLHASRVQVAVTVLPVTVIFMTMISFNNICLRYVEASFYMVARSTHILFNIVLSYALLGKRTSLGAMASCVVITVGIMISSASEVNYSVLGGLFGVLSTVFVALYSIYVSKAMQALGGNQWLLLQYNTLLSVIFLPLVIVITGEHSTLLYQWKTVLAAYSVDFWLVVLASGICGIGVAVAAYMQIKLTSPLTHMVSGTVKGIAQTFLSFVLFGNPYTSSGIIGTALVIAGSFAYSLIRRAENQRSQLSTEKKSQ